MATTTVTWMWIGNSPQINATPYSASTRAEADNLAGYKAGGPDAIRAVDLTGETHAVRTSEGRSTVFSHSFNDHPDGISRFAYESPETDSRQVSQITGFMRVDYKLTFPDGTSAQQEGVLIQMYNGDMFFRPSKDDLPAWSRFSSLNSVEIIRADPVPATTYVAPVSFSPSVKRMEVNCFAAGTLILTAEGERPVEALRAGDMIWTQDQGFQPLRWTGTSRFDAIDLRTKPSLRPILIQAGALGVNQPSQALAVSRQHRIMIRSVIAQDMFGANEILVPACQLTQVPGITLDEQVEHVTYVHLMFDAHQVLLSNGALTESLYPGPQALIALGAAALAEIDDIFPGILEGAVPPAGARPFLRGPKLRDLLGCHASDQQMLVS